VKNLTIVGIEPTGTRQIGRSFISKVPTQKSKFLSVYRECFQSISWEREEKDKKKIGRRDGKRETKMEERGKKRCWTVRCFEDVHVHSWEDAVMLDV